MCVCYSNAAEDGCAPRLLLLLLRLLTAAAALPAIKP